jgi:hypothetical protein
VGGAEAGGGDGVAVAIGRTIEAVVSGRAAVGEGDSFRLHPSLPPRGTLEYVQTAATALLLVLALLVFAYYTFESPKTALRMALARVGMRP